MSAETAEADWTRIRRHDRAVDDEAWIEDFLRTAPVGVLATVHDGQPFVNSNIFVWAATERVVYFHTARTGRTRTNVETDGRACFTISTMGRLLPAKTALEMSVEYSGVVIFGRVAVVADPAQQRSALQLLLDKYFPHLQPGRDYRPPTDEELARTTVYRLAVECWSGKRKEVAADFPGAFFYGQAPGQGGGS
jgi:nitroimidazol reductase NimA-like FMN-containing flavoprotein (pyridoxamine 5'-phosphate oxidase superfamily)